MSLNVTFNGSMYIIPETGEVGWGGNTTSYLVAIAAGALQKTGGSFTLSADTDFGASFGLKSLYYKSRSANIAAAGIVRLNNNSDSINWRNAANSADLALFPNASNLLTFNGSTVYVIGAGTITNADISPSAAIAYSKLNLSNSIVNADVNVSAAIDYSKLNVPAGAITYAKLTLTNSVVNADINASAAIAFTKMAAQTASRMIVSDASGFHVASNWNYNATNDLTTGANDELRFQDSAGGDYVAFRAPAAVTTHTYDLPIAAGTAGQVLSWQAGGQLQWINATGTGTINSGVSGYFTYYPATGTTVDDQAILFTDGTNISFLSGQVLHDSGTEALPGISFTGKTNLGISSPSATEMRFNTGGTARLILNSTSLNSVVALTIDKSTATSIFIGDGSNSTPGQAFQNDNDTGYSRPAGNTFRIVGNAQPMKDFAPTQHIAYISGTSTFQWNAADYSPSTNNIIDLGTSALNWRSLYLSTSIKNGATTLATVTELGYLTGVTSAIQTQFTGKASTALSNLASVAINTSLLPATDNAIDVGSTTKTFANVYAQNLNGGQFGSFRNRVINGDMVIDQRNGGAAVTVNATTTFRTIDKWAATGGTTAGVFTVQRSTTTPPTGFNFHLRHTVTTADASPSSGQSYSNRNDIETFFVGDIYSTTGMAAVNLSFWVRSSLTGTFGFGIVNLDASSIRSYVGQYTINSANTWEYKTVAIPVDTSTNTITYGNYAFQIRFDLGSGSSREGTANSWTVGAFWRASGNTRLIGTNAATLDLSGVQLEAGAVPTKFEFTPVDMQLQRCHRYYEKSYPINTAPGASEGSTFIGVGTKINTNQVRTHAWPFKVRKRVTPTVSLWSQSGVSGEWVWTTSAAVNTSRATTAPNITEMMFNVRETTSESEFYTEGHWIADAD